MNYSTELFQWIMNSIFIIGVFLLPVGLSFCLFPKKIFEVANRMNKWIITDHFFDTINKESFFYRYHRIFGMVVIIVSMASLYTLTFYLGIESIIDVLNKLSGSAFEKWLFVILYYLLLGFVAMTVIIGIIMFVRPSVLKSFEKWCNYWVDTDTPLKVLDRENNMPDKILPGSNPRVFGLFVILGAIYMLWSAWPQ
jgi:hypothetical protein